jgi:Lon protease-like protein
MPAVLALDAVPLFPLPGHVLLPGLPVPFHIFEPRYRALVRDLLAKPAGERWLAIPRIAPGHEAEAAGEPPLLPIVAAARLAAASELGDGRFHIAVIGEGRWHLDEQPGDRPYRQAHLVRMPEPLLDPGMTTRVASAVRRIIGEHPVITDEISALLDVERHGPASVLDRLAALTLVDPDLRQRFLEAESACCRLRVLEGAQCCSGEIQALN